MFHYLRLESYEDTLNNLRFRSLDGPLFAALDVRPDYLLHYTAGGLGHRDKRALRGRRDVVGAGIHRGLKPAPAQQVEVR